MDAPMKRCTKCGTEYPATSEYFYPNYSRCKPCSREASKRWAAEHRDRTSEYQRNYRERDRDAYNAGRRRRYAKNPSAVLEQNRRYRERNAERERERVRQWRQENPQQSRNIAKSWQRRNPQARKAIIHRRSARKRGLPDNFSERDWNHALKYFGYRCAVCGRPQGLWHTLSADHWIPLSAPGCPGTIPANIVPLCHGDCGCNNSKHNRDAEEWLIAKLGKRKARAKLAEIAAYFDWIREQDQP